MSTIIKPISVKELFGGIQKIYRFKNNFGASVVKHSYSYGGEKDLWELAVIEWNGPYWSLCYSMPITDDVEGYLTDDEVEKILGRIQSLPMKEELK